MTQLNPDQLYQAFGKLVRQHRIRLHMTQESLGEKIGLSRTSVTNIEKGRQHVPLHQLITLAHALRTPPETLLPKVSKGATPSWVDSKLPPGIDKNIADWANTLIDEHK